MPNLERVLLLHLMFGSHTYINIMYIYIMYITCRYHTTPIMKFRSGADARRGWHFRSHGLRQGGRPKRLEPGKRSAINGEVLFD